MFSWNLIKHWNLLLSEKDFYPKNFSIYESFKILRNPDNFWICWNFFEQKKFSMAALVHENSLQVISSSWTHLISFRIIHSKIARDKLELILNLSYDCIKNFNIEISCQLNGIFLFWKFCHSFPRDPQIYYINDLIHNYITLFNFLESLMVK